MLRKWPIYCAILAALSLGVSTTVLQGSWAAAEEVSPDVPDDALVEAPAEPAPDEWDPQRLTGDCSAGWRYNVTDKSRRMAVGERFGYTNRDYHGEDLFVFSASRTFSREFSYGYNISASAGSALFGEIKAEVNAQVRQSVSYGTSFGGQKSVKPRHVAHAKLGIMRTRVYGKSYYLSSFCKRSQVNMVGGAAPYEAAWSVGQEPI